MTPLISITLLSALMLASLAGPAKASPPAAGTEVAELPRFVEVQKSGINFLHVNGARDRKDYIPEAKGGGIGFFDYDGDGWMDVYVSQGSLSQDYQKGQNLQHGSLFRNQRDGTFEDVTNKAGITRTGWGMGVGAADYDNDGDVDLYLTFLGPNALYRNNGDGTFTDVTGAAGVGDDRWSTSAAFGDYDRDGDLDLYVANYINLDFDNLPARKCNHRGNVVLCGPLGLEGAADVLYRNNGDGTFTDVTTQSGAHDKDRYFGLGVVWADLDNDHDLDLIVANDATPNLLFVNQGDSTFVELGYPSGLAVNADGLEQAGMGIDAADYNNDDLLDVIMTHFALEYSTLYVNRGNLGFEDVTSRAGIMEPAWLLVSWGVAFVDFDHDGWKDLIHSNGHVYPYLIQAQLNEKYEQPKSFYRNNRDGTFSDVSNRVGSDVQIPRVGRGTAFSDFDNDGDIDFVAAHLNGTPSLYRSEQADERNHWVMFRTRGRKSNRDGIGARITVETAGLRQTWEIKRTVGIYSVSDPRAHFGLGAAGAADKVTVRWPSGGIQEFDNVPANVHYVIDEQLGLSREFPGPGSRPSSKP